VKEHYTRSTISAEAWCAKCQKHTQHRVDDCQKGPCLECIARLEKEYAVKKSKPEKQMEQMKLFAGERK
jgi:ribosomal protein L44E